MKNKSIDLRNHLFEALERLQDDELTTEQLQREIERSQAITQVAHGIIGLAKVEVLYYRTMMRAGNAVDTPQPFFPPLPQGGGEQ